ncbi:unnamed protein product, partial [Meganyctiphanes norvegica]
MHSDQVLMNLLDCMQDSINSLQTHLSTIMDLVSHDYDHLADEDSNIVSTHRAASSTVRSHREDTTSLGEKLSRDSQASLIVMPPELKTSSYVGTVDSTDNTETCEEMQPDEDIVAKIDETLMELGSILRDSSFHEEQLKDIPRDSFELLEHTQKLDIEAKEVDIADRENVVETREIKMKKREIDMDNKEKNMDARENTLLK